MTWQMLKACDKTWDMFGMTNAVPPGVNVCGTKKDDKDPPYLPGAMMTQISPCPSSVGIGAFTAFLVLYGLFDVWVLSKTSSSM